MDRCPVKVGDGPDRCENDVVEGSRRCESHRHSSVGFSLTANQKSVLRFATRTTTLPPSLSAAKLANAEAALAAKGMLVEHEPTEWGRDIVGGLRY